MPALESVIDRRARARKAAARRRREKLREAAAYDFLARRARFQPPASASAASRSRHAAASEMARSGSNSPASENCMTHLTKIGGIQPSATARFAHAMHRSHQNSAASIASQNPHQRILEKSLAIPHLESGCPGCPNAPHRRMPALTTMSFRAYRDDTRQRHPGMAMGPQLSESTHHAAQLKPIVFQTHTRSDKCSHGAVTPASHQSSPSLPEAKLNYFRTTSSVSPFSAVVGNTSVDNSRRSWMSAVSPFGGLHLFRRTPKPRTS